MLSTISAALALALTQPGTLPGPEVTIYNQGFGLVKESRLLDLKNGRQQLSISDVPCMIDATSVAIRSVTKPGSFDVLEQNYRYDLVNVESILNKSVSRRIRLIRHFNSKREVLEGTLASAPTAIVSGADGGSAMQYNGMVVKLDDGHILLDPVGEVEVLSMPDGLISLPTLVWDLESRWSGKNQIELSYIANGMRWDASYVLTLDAESNRCHLQGWASVNNASGATYTNAVLKLLAGDVHQAPNAKGVQTMITATYALDEAPPPMKEEQLFEYHLYTLQRPATIRDKETKQLSLLEGSRVPFRKRMVIDSLKDFGAYYPTEGEIGGGDLRPQVRIEFVNDSESGLGMPLPAGRFRIYQRDKSGAVQLLGEDAIQHTPKNEKVSLLVGNAFDIVANRKRLSYRRVGPREMREQFEIVVRNRKATAETVELLERHYQDWKVEETSDPFTKEDANTMRFALSLKPNQVRTVKYVVRTKW